MTHLQAVIDQLEAERFVGRTEELALFRNLVQSDKPALLNIHGVGGIGKTSLLRAFAREAAALGAIWLSVDGAGLQPSPREFCRQLWAELEAHPLSQRAATAAGDAPAAASMAACHAAITSLAASGRPIVVAIDTYEELKPLDRWLRQSFLAGLPPSTIIVIAGRTPLSGEWLDSPAWRMLIHPLPLQEFTLVQVRDFLDRHGVSDEQAIHGLWFGTRGHPLALTLAVSLAGTDFALQHSEQADAVFEELMRRWLIDAASEKQRQLVEAAAMLPDWDQDTLSEITGQPVPMSDFEQLILLSFVRRTRRGWSLHSLVRDAAAAHLRAVSPSRYHTYRQRALEHLYRRLLDAPPHDLDERTRLVSQAFYLIGSPLMQQVFAHDPADAGFFVEPATAEEITAWSSEPPPWRSTTYLARLLQPLAEPTAKPVEQPEHEQGMDMRQASPSYLQELLTLDPECILVMRDGEGHHHGILVAIPVTSSTLPFLRSQPVTAAYFGTLTPAELAEFAGLNEPGGCYIRAIGLSNPEDSNALAALIYHAIPLLFTHGRVLTSTPLTFYQRILQGLGFVEVPGASHYDFGPDRAAPTFLLDLRGTHLAAHIERLALQAGFEPLQAPDPFAALNLTPREREVAALVAEGLSNREIAERLYLSEITVKKHLSQVLAKAGLKNRGQLIRLAHSSGGASQGQGR